MVPLDSHVSMLLCQHVRTHRAEILLRCTFSCNAVRTLPDETPNCNPVWLTVTLASSSRMARTAATLSSVVAERGRPLRSSSLSDCRPRGNSANQLKTHSHEGASSTKSCTEPCKALLLLEANLVVVINHCSPVLPSKLHRSISASSDYTGFIIEQYCLCKIKCLNIR